MVLKELVLSELFLHLSCRASNCYRPYSPQFFWASTSPPDPQLAWPVCTSLWYSVWSPNWPSTSVQSSSVAPQSVLIWFFLRSLPWSEEPSLPHLCLRCTSQVSWFRCTVEHGYIASSALNYQLCVHRARMGAQSCLWGEDWSILSLGRGLVNLASRERIGQSFPACKDAR